MHKMKNNLFNNVKIKLTIYYVLIMSVVLIIFSAALIYSVDINLEENLNGKVIITENKESPIEHASDDIESIIFYIDGILILIITLLSYFLAKKTLKPIKDSIDAQKKFSADASHDLRTPISIIISESELALSDKNEKDLKGVIESNLEEAKKMSKLVGDLLIIFRNENKNIKDKLIQIDLHYFIGKIVSKMKIKAEDKGLKLTLNDYKKILLEVDISNFERAILNIIENSIYYTKKGSIHIDISDDNKYAYIIVSDTGVGINEKDLPYIFDRFYKAEHSRNDESGSGLGLPISKQAIIQLKGTIEVQSKPNEGTTVKILIPKN